MDSIDYYERYGSAYFENTVNLSMEEQLKQFLLYLPENAEVLDLGCGSGRDGKYLEESGCYVTLMDGSRQMCRLAEIYTDQDKLYVSNPLIPKLEPTTGTGIGLKNLASRYELLTSREVEITATDGAFRVGLPLLEPESSEK